MSETTHAYLNGLLARYTPSSAYFDAAKSHRAAIQTRVDLKLGLAEMFETGSLRHGTGVWWWSDVDYMVSLKGFKPTSPTTTLNRLRDELKERFPTTHVHVSRPAVVCDFASKSETVEVVPAFAADGGGYWIPDPRTGDWMKTFPKHHNAYVNEVNKKHAGGAKKLARLAKVWKYRRSVPVSSCYLEMRAAKYANAEVTWDLPQDIHRYLVHLQTLDLAGLNDPTGLGSRFNAYSSESTKADALSKLNTAVVRASRARDFAAAGLHTSAIEQYKLLFNQQ